VKSRRHLRIAVSLGLQVVLGLLASLAHAQPTFTVGTTTVTPNPVQPGVTITITTSITNTSSALASGIIVDEEIYDAAGVNPGSERLADVYFGVLLPAEAGAGLGCPAGDAIACVGDNFQRIVITCASAAAQSFTPLMRSVMVAGPVTGVRVTDFWNLPWAAGLPPGRDTLFMVLTSPNAFDDGRVDPADLLATAVDTVTFVP
jgi:hypothetical protein